MSHLRGNVRVAVQEYRSQMDVMEQFLLEYTDSSPTHETLFKEIYEAYRVWCDCHGHRPKSSRSVGVELGRRGFKKSHNGDGNVVYKGIAVKPEVFAVKL